jgi:hypothetical protein
MYASRAEGELFGKEKAGVVYINMVKRMGLTDARNELLAAIGEDLDQFRENLKILKIEEIETKIAEIIGEYSDFFIIHMNQII